MKNTWPRGFILLLRAMALGLIVSIAACATSTTPPPAPPAAIFQQSGLASFYAARLNGRRTASGERYDKHAMTAAHRHLPFGTIVRVINLKNGRKVEVRINDRGPYRKGRIIDLSHAAAKQLGMLTDGVTRVKISSLHATQ